MTVTERWVDLLDPTAEEISGHVPDSIHARALEQLLAPSTHDDEPRPKLEAHGDYVFGVLLVAVEVTDEDLVYYQELNLIMTREMLLTIRKTPPGGRPPYDPSPAQLSCRDHDSIGMVVYHLVDDIAERFLDLVDALTDEIEELEEGIDQWDFRSNPPTHLGLASRHAQHPAHALAAAGHDPTGRRQSHRVRRRGGVHA